MNKFFRIFVKPLEEKTCIVPKFAIRNDSTRINISCLPKGSAGYLCFKNLYNKTFSWKQAYGTGCISCDMGFLYLHQFFQSVGE